MWNWNSFACYMKVNAPETKPLSAPKGLFTHWKIKRYKQNWLQWVQEATNKETLNMQKSPNQYFCFNSLLLYYVCLFLSPDTNKQSATKSCKCNWSGSSSAGHYRNLRCVKCFLCSSLWQLALAIRDGSSLQWAHYPPNPNPAQRLHLTFVLN